MLNKEEAKLEWYRLDSEGQTFLNSTGEDDNTQILRIAAKNRLKGFIQGLQFAGMMGDEKQ